MAFHKGRERTLVLFLDKRAEQHTVTLVGSVACGSQPSDIPQGSLHRSVGHCPVLCNAILYLYSDRRSQIVRTS